MTQANLSQQEQEILKFWQKNKIFQKSLEKNQGKPPFVFYEGPPTANGRPGIHHFLARAFKDIITRYKTMRGFYVERRAGWDTHGLPVELEVEKALGLNSKGEIESYGIAKFNQKAKESVWRYKEEWERFSQRMGFWLDFDHPYITYEPEYIESLWWIISQFDKKGLLYQDFRVSPYCPRCGTPLSSHEVAQGYRRVKEESVFVKFKVKSGSARRLGLDLPDNTYLVAWTTTPWTLPGNEALAVGGDIEYVLVKPSVTLLRNSVTEEEGYILAKSLAGKVLGDSYEVLRELRGKELEGLAYEPLFSINLLQNERSHRVYLADFVSTEEGTGLVHIAPMYGEDDFELGRRVGLPKQHTVDETGRFNQLLEPFDLAGQKVKQKDTEKQILDYLEKKNLLLKKQPYEHEYPHCWRCGTALLYYALESYFVATTKLKEKLIKNNQKINWVPSHIKAGRFGQFLEELKDWAFSRSRYWGTPLPIWQCQAGQSQTKNNFQTANPKQKAHPQGCGHSLVVGSLEDLDKHAYYKNNFIILRHGEAESNVRGIVASDLKSDTSQLTKAGQKSIQKVALELKKQGIKLIFSSPFRRARQTAELVAKITGAKVYLDKRLQEIATGEFNGKPVEQYHKFFKNDLERFTKRPPGGENLTEVKRRTFEFLREINGRYTKERILIVSHSDPLWMLEAAVKQLSDKQALSLRPLEPGEYRQLKLHNYPYNAEGQLDLHRPFVDEVVLKCPACGGPMRRVEYVVDVWFDSGAMPFAQAHFPFACAQAQSVNFAAQKDLDRLIQECLAFPADFIAEGIDQTRGWFYTLHAVATLLGQGPAFKNVISHGLVLDATGKKMSKSQGNVVDPWQQMELFGADAIRWFFYVVNQPGENKRYDEKELKAHRSQFLLTLLNSLRFWQLAGEQLAAAPPGASKTRKKRSSSKNILDQWLASRLARTNQQVTQALDKYNVTGAARALEELVDDLSNWYIRRSRQRLRQDRSAWQFLGQVLMEISQLIAPFTPFLAEMMFQKLKEGRTTFLLESVHLSSWPKAKLALVDERLEQQMERVRQLASLALEQRAQAGIKVRQPLSRLEIGDQSLPQELLELLKQEVNVKEIKINKHLGNEVRLDTKLTEPLRQEGLLRELMRQLNFTRQKLGLDPSDQVVLQLQATPLTRALVRKFAQELQAGAGLRSVQLVAEPSGAYQAVLVLDQEQIRFALDKT